MGGGKGSKGGGKGDKGDKGKGKDGGKGTLEAITGTERMTFCLLLNGAMFFFLFLFTMLKTNLGEYVFFMHHGDSFDCLSMWLLPGQAYALGSSSCPNLTMILQR